ncbi:hypothetical protein [Kribbella sp. NPDC004536]|uniref:hypothetical protein n=1 Tax=Kribbella sp. NPDC004536 TaxID=3364106 RepID=UPI0036CAE965
MSSPPPGPNYNWQPQPGNYKSAPTYGQPPRKSRAGLILALIVVLALIALTAIGILAYRLVNNHQTPNATATPSAPHTPAPTAHPSTAHPSSAHPTAVRPTTAHPTATRPTATHPTTAPPTTARPPQTGPAAATTIGRQFVAQLNANNPTAAAALACKGSEQLIPTLIQALLTPPTNLTLGQPIGQDPTYVVPLTGKTNNTPVTGVLIIQTHPPTPTCIQAFQVTPH